MHSIELPPCKWWWQKREPTGTTIVRKCMIHTLYHSSDRHPSTFLLTYHVSCLWLGYCLGSLVDVAKGAPGRAGVWSSVFAGFRLAKVVSMPAISTQFGWSRLNEASSTPTQIILPLAWALIAGPCCRRAPHPGPCHTIQMLPSLHLTSPSRSFCSSTTISVAF